MLLTFSRSWRTPASQIEAIFPDFVHQWSAVSLGTGPIRHRVNKLSFIVQNFGADIREPIHLTPTVGQFTEENRDIVVRVGTRITARARAEQHDAVDPVAISFSDCHFEAL